ncbi:unnamed protein product, partial [Cuscuta epithymum]
MEEQVEKVLLGLVFEEDIVQREVVEETRGATNEIEEVEEEREESEEVEETRGATNEIEEVEEEREEEAAEHRIDIGEGEEAHDNKIVGEEKKEFPFRLQLLFFIMATIEMACNIAALIIKKGVPAKTLSTVASTLGMIGVVTSVSMIIGMAYPLVALHTLHQIWEASIFLVEFFTISYSCWISKPVENVVHFP